MFRKYIFYFYWFLLLYSLAALSWNSIIILKQNHNIYLLKKSFLNQKKLDKLEYINENNIIFKQYKNKVYQYISEIITFFLILLSLAFLIYKKLKKEFLMHQKEQNFLLGMTHEFKTPIAIILLNLETIKKRKFSKEITNSLVINSIDETKRLIFFYENILTSARLEEKNKHTYFDYFTLNELFDKYNNMYKNNNEIFLSINYEHNLKLFCDKDLLNLCFINLINNSIKYCDEIAFVTINAYSEKNKIIIEVKDNGIGIPENEKKYIFEKFYRINNPFKEKNKGTGLGLFLVKKIIDIHKGAIFVSSNIPKGTIFKIIFNENKKKNSTY